MPWLQGAENMKELLKTTEEGGKKIKHSLLFPLSSSLSLPLSQISQTVMLSLSLTGRIMSSLVVTQYIQGHLSLRPVEGAF